MINRIIDGIAIALNSEFGDGYEIYTEPVNQGLKEPCFSILCLNPTINKKLGKRYFRTNMFCLHYFPATADEHFESYDVAERLIDCLENIIVEGDKCRGTEIHFEITDGILSFFVNYNMFVYKVSESEPKMEELEQNGMVKE